jgi:O-antigen ligase/polysaccharide polymerase Wzy-like membrane protein/tetratricopeptide repeat protein
VSNDHETHRGQDNRASVRVPSVDELVVGGATAATTFALAAASGGFYAVAWSIGILVAAWAGVLAVLWTGPRVTRHSLALAGATAVVFAWTVLSAFWSDSVTSSADEAERTLLYVAVVMAALGLGTRLALTPVAFGIVSGAVGVSVWNLTTRWGGLYGREANPVGYSNALALLVAIALVLACGLVLERHWIALIAFAPFAAVLKLSRSNGSWAALIAGAVLFGLLTSRLSRRLVVAGAVVVAAAFAAAAIVEARGHERGGYWPPALHEIAANPLLGSGAGTYHVWFVRLRADHTSTVDAHSLYLETLAELGPVGLVAIAALLGVPLAAVLELRRRPLAVAAGAAVVVYVLAAGVDFHWELPAVTAPVLLVGAALTQSVGARQPVAQLALAAALVTVGVAGAVALAGQAPLSASDDALAAARFEDALADARRARRWMPWSAAPLRLLGEARLALGDRAAARAAFEAAVQKDPNDWSGWLRLAAVSTGEVRRRAEARAAHLNPLYFR